MDIKTEPEPEAGNMDPLGIRLKREQVEHEVIPEPTLINDSIEIKDEPLPELEEIIQSEVENFVLAPEVFICNICNQFFSSNPALNMHITKTHRLKKVKNSLRCQYCKFTTKNKQILQKHMLFIHIFGTCKKLRCKICSEMMLNLVKMKKLLVKKRRKKYAVCDYNIVNGVVNIIGNAEAKSNAVTNNANETVESMDIDDNASDHWGDAYEVPENISDDNSNDTQENKIQELVCKFCDKEFKSRDILETHIQNVHSQNDKYIELKHKYRNIVRECCVKLRRIDATQNVDKNQANTCTICNKSFENKYVVNWHISSQHNKNETNHESNISSQINENKNETNYVSPQPNENKNEASHENNIVNENPVNLLKQRFNCNFCNTNLRSKQNLETHIKSIHLSANNLELNTKSHTKNIPICDICKKVFSRHHNLRRHIKTQHNRGQHLCTICNFKFKCKQSLINHKRISHSENLTPKYNENSELNVDKDNKIGRKCMICNKVFTRLYGLKVHMKQQHKVDYDTYVHSPSLNFSNIHQSYNINMDTSDKSNLLNESVHSNLNLKDNEVVKIQEKTVHSSLSNLSSSIDISHENKETEVNSSLKRSLPIKNKYNLECNKKKHSKNEIKCMICNKVFTRVYGLKVHMKQQHKVDYDTYVHSPSLNFSSIHQSHKINISSQHNENKNVASHENNIVNENLAKLLRQIFICNFCNTNLGSKQNLETHIKSIHLSADNLELNTESYMQYISTCYICKKVSSSYSNLKRHVNRLHQTEWCLKCSICSQLFKCQNTLINHKINAHNKNIFHKYNKNKINAHNENINHKYNGNSENNEINRRKCIICNKVMTKFFNLKRHMQNQHGVDYDTYLHSSSLNLSSSISNETNVTDGTNLLKLCDNNVGNIHNNSKVKVQKNDTRCNLCNIVLFDPRNLKNHMKLIHTGDLKCEICNAKFKYDYMLGRHKLAIHNVNINYSETLNKYCITLKNKVYCKFCNKAYSTLITCKIHIKKIHFINNNIKTNEIITPELEKLILNNMQIGSYFCDYCGIKENSKNELEKHLLTSHYSNIYLENDTGIRQICIFCNRRSYELKIHLDIYHKTVECKICNAKFSNSTLLKRHEERKHKSFKLKPEHRKNFYKYIINEGNNKFHCKFCNTLFTNKGNCYAHIIMHFIKNNINLDEEITEEIENTIIKNTVKKIIVNKYKCNICDIKFDKLLVLKKHIKKIHIKNGWKCGKHYYCDICKKSFISSVTLGNHMKSQHPIGEPQIYKCKICDFQSKHKTCLQTHTSNIHEGKARLLTCKYCGRRFKRQKILNNHIELAHPNVGIQNKCDKCNKIFTSKYTLKLHIKYMHPIDDTKYLCHLCPKTFRNKNVLTAHIKNHDPKLCCEVCGALFYNKTVLAQHIEGHDRIPKVFCDFCKKGFRRKEGMVKHYFAFHCEVKKPRKKRTVKKKLDI